MIETNSGARDRMGDASRLLHRPSLYGGSLLMVIWLFYAIYLIVSNLELPDGGEAMSLLAVALVMFALGWCAVRISAHLMDRVRRRIASGW